jgi:hypothetical protein
MTRPTIPDAGFAADDIPHPQASTTATHATTLRT